MSIEDLKSCQTSHGCLCWEMMCCYNDHDDERNRWIYICRSHLYLCPVKQSNSILLCSRCTQWLNIVLISHWFSSFFLSSPSPSPDPLWRCWGCCWWRWSPPPRPRAQTQRGHSPLGELWLVDVSRLSCDWLISRYWAVIGWYLDTELWLVVSDPDTCYRASPGHMAWHGAQQWCGQVSVT